MNKTLVLIAGFLAMVGLIVSVVADLDNLYGVTISSVHVVSHTLALLWLLTVILTFAGVLVGNRKATATTSTVPP
jgi:hypothetical protein